MYKSVTIINDCASPNDRGRQMTRVSSLFGINPTFIELHNFSDLEASGQIIDTLDAMLDIPGIILTNAAPRHGKAKKWPNGTPFAWVEIGESLLITTIDGSTLSLIKKLKLADSVNVMDIPTVLSEPEIIKIIGEQACERIKKTQFRSFEFVPRVAKFLSAGIEISAEEYSMDEVADPGKRVWYIDGFGNCKTNILPEEIEFEPGKIIETKFGDLQCYAFLKDVPNDERALIIGSSGYKEQRFLEIVAQGKAGNKELGINVGDEIF